MKCNKCSFDAVLEFVMPVMSIPPFVAGGSRYDQTTYFGRFRTFIDVVDPRTLLASDADIAQAEQRIRDLDGTDAQLWEDQKLVSAANSNGRRIPAPFRMAAFVPMNIPLVAGMLNSQSLPATLFWQWANQTFNSATNYCNRPGDAVSNEELMKSYGIAVGSSCGLAYSFRWLAQNGPPRVKAICAVPFVVPYIAVGAAGAINLFFSRKSELVTGIPVTDETGKNLGNSQIAAQQGLLKTIMSRSLGLPIPVLVLPAVAMRFVPKSLPAGPRMITELVAITSSLCLALPATLAIFPQTMEFDPKSLEPQFHNVQGKILSNKGL